MVNRKFHYITGEEYLMNIEYSFRAHPNDIKIKPKTLQYDSQKNYSSQIQRIWETHGVEKVSYRLYMKISTNYPGASPEVS